jgi:hypothetical protein
VDHQRRVADEGEEFLDHFRKERLARQERGGQAVDRKGLRRHVPLGIHVAVKGLPRRHAIEELDAADLDQAVAADRVKAGSFGIENDFAHVPVARKRRIRPAVSAS